VDPIKVDGGFSVMLPDESDMSVPFIYEDDDLATLYFCIGSIQSQMKQDRPDHLVLSYTRTMMAFLLFNPSPKTIAMIGLGGGSMAKWCYRELPSTDITVAEINPHVIALRDYFYVPPDNERFRVICEDGAEYVARTYNELAVLLVDGFDADGQPPELCTQEFYHACWNALTPSGVLVVNLCGRGDRINICRIKHVFDDRALVVVPHDGGNRVAFAWKEGPMWHEENAGSISMKIKEFEYHPKL
jgi:spermidine synthase